MKKSLKNSLTELIWRQGYLSFEGMEQFCRKQGKKPSNGERRLRASESPTIEAVRKNGAIIGYKPRRKIVSLPPAFPTKQIETNKSLF